MNDAGKSGKSAGSRLHIDVDAIRELCALLNETSLSEIEIEENGRRIRVARQQSTVSFPPAPSVSHTSTNPVSSQQVTEVPASKRDVKGVVASPMVGTVYVSPEPGKSPFVQIGDAVREGDTLLIVEAMKTMNPIPAPHAGVVKEICVADAQPVEFGQALMIVSPAA